MIDWLLELATKATFAIFYIACAASTIEVIGLTTGAYSFSMPHRASHDTMIRDVFIHCNRMHYSGTPCESLFKEFEKYKKTHAVPD